MAAENYSVNTLPAFSALIDGAIILFKANVTGGGGDVLSVNGTPFYNLVKQIPGSGIAVQVGAGDIQAGGQYLVSWNASISNWNVLGGIG